MEIRSILIKDTTKEERIRIVQEGLSQCGGACDFCNGCDNLGGGIVDSFYEPYINGEKELRELNDEYRRHAGLVREISASICRLDCVLRSTKPPAVRTVGEESLSL